MKDIKKGQVDCAPPMQQRKPKLPHFTPPQSGVIQLSSSESDSAGFSTSGDDEVFERGESSNAREKRSKKGKELGVVLPPGFLDPLPLSISNLENGPCLALPPSSSEVIFGMTSKQFWKAGDYEGSSGSDWTSIGGMDHVRVHPRFLHSNATSHKWVLGALAELLDNAVDEVRNGATYVSIDMVSNKKDGSKMLLLEDNGGGMSPEKMRHCMSLGYSAKSHMLDTIGQYGNGFKTSTMRLGADVIVFSRSRGKNGARPTQSIGLLSYTFLTSTGKEDIVVPMVDYEKGEDGWCKIVRSTDSDWDLNIGTIIQWSPFGSEKELLQQFYQMKGQGTRIIIYNLWEDDQGHLELDFDAEPHDIQTRGANRDEKNIEMAQKYLNSKHFLTYRHSLRSYAAILYLRVPAGFKIILRGKDVEHHHVVNDMMMSKEITYRPQPGSDGIPRDSNMVAVVTVGFVKDAKSHIDVQGFNVYHKNRLIKPFWRVWNPAGSDGRGVIGVLEANFVEPAHDKQGFERTSVLSRLESKLVQLQKSYWTENCHKIGYAPRGKSATRETDSILGTSMKKENRRSFSNSRPVEMQHDVSDKGYACEKNDSITPRKRPAYSEMSSDDDDRASNSCRKRSKCVSISKDVLVKDGSRKSSVLRHSDEPKHSQTTATPPWVTRSSKSQTNGLGNNESSPLDLHENISLAQLEKENQILRKRLKQKEEIASDLQRELQTEKEKCKSLNAELQVLTSQYEELKKEQENLIDIFSQEGQRRDKEEETLRQKIKEASNTIHELLAKVKWFERKGT